ncbi:MAG: hypothetical protein RLZZ139_2540, partial [Cyanobacteriota bacterium]
SKNALMLSAMKLTKQDAITKIDIYSPIDAHAFAPKAFNVAICASVRFAAPSIIMPS